MKVAILEYNAGNVRSVQYALARLGVEAELSADPEIIRRADRVIFPGVGEARSTMRYLRERGLDTLLASLSQPVLGICLGLQLLCAFSEEGGTECVGVFPERVVKFTPDPAHGIKVPHMGWNTLSGCSGPLFHGIGDGAHVYFVHSYFAECGADTVASAHHSRNFSAALARGNFYATQFHPEKSGMVGERILRNFLEL